MGPQQETSVPAHDGLLKPAGPEEQYISSIAEYGTWAVRLTHGSRVLFS